MSYRDHMREAEREYVAGLLSEHRVTVAAQIAGVTRSSFYRIMARCGIKPERKRREGRYGNEAWKEMRC